MNDFLRLIIDSIQFLWPFRLVERWERGVYSVCGRWVFEVKPGIYPIVPWFCEVRQQSVVTAILGTPRQDITLSDGSTLTFSATAKVRVVDALVACVSVDDYHETTQELIGSVLADKLADVDKERLSPEKRRRLIADLRAWINKETLEWGVEVSHLRFTTFVLNVRTYRIMQESGAVAPW